MPPLRSYRSVENSDSLTNVYHYAFVFSFCEQWQSVPDNYVSERLNCIRNVIENETAANDRSARVSAACCLNFKPHRQCRKRLSCTKKKRSRIFFSKCMEQSDTYIRIHTYVLFNIRCILNIYMFLRYVRQVFYTHVKRARYAAGGLFDLRKNFQGIEGNRTNSFFILDLRFRRIAPKYFPRIPVLFRSCVANPSGFSSSLFVVFFLIIDNRDREQVAAVCCCSRETQGGGAD